MFLKLVLRKNEFKTKNLKAPINFFLPQSFLSADKEKSIVTR